MKNNFIICLLLAQFMLSSCSSQNKKCVDLAQLSSNFDVSGFYRDRVKKTEEITSKDPKSMDKKSVLKLLDNAFFVKDTLGYFPTGGRFGTALSLETTNDWMVRNKKATEIFGYEYKTVKYNPDKDTLALLNTVSFPKMDMVEDTKGNLMYLEVGKTSKNGTDLNKIKDFLNKNSKSITVEDDDKKKSYWEGKSFFYRLSVDEGKENGVASTEINLVLFEKSYIKKMDDLRIYSAGYELWKKPR